MGYRTKIKQQIINILIRKRIKKLFAKWEKIYGKFDSNNYEAFSVNDLPNESGYYHGELIKWAADLYPNCVLFAGEKIKTATYLRDKVNAKKIITTGLSEVDYRWNFEHNAPDILGKIDVIISHAIFEHLLNPYQHLTELAKLVETKGVLIIHTVMLGFRYHRYPIDTLRFYPDWFEKMAERLQLKIVNKRIKEGHIFYMYQKI